MYRSAKPNPASLRRKEPRIYPFGDQFTFELSYSREHVYLEHRSRIRVTGINSLTWADQCNPVELEFSDELGEMA